MAEPNFTRERRRTWATSSLPGPPGPFPPTLRYKRSLALHDAGPYRLLLMRQCLHLLHDFNDEVERLARYASMNGRDAGHQIRDMTPRIHAVCEMLRAGVDRDFSISVGRVVRTLRTYRTDLLLTEAWPRYRLW
jgi:hypothetical protein